MNRTVLVYLHCPLTVYLHRSRLSDMNKPTVEYRFNVNDAWKLMPSRNIDAGISAAEILEFNEIIGWQKFRILDA